jgi:two-component system, NtrC family, sensor kinase
MIMTCYDKNLLNIPKMVPWPHPWKLQVKASLIILLIVGGAILVTEWLHQYYVAELAKDAVHSKSLVLLRQIGARFQSEHQFHNAALREKYLNDLMSRNPDLVLLRLYGKGEMTNDPPQLFTQIGDNQEDTPEMPLMVIQTLQAEQPQGSFHNQKGDNRLKLSTPLSIQGNTVGVIYAEYWTGHLNTITRFFLNWSLIVRLLMGIGIVLALNFFLYRHVIRPLGRLKAGLAEVEKGHWATLVPDGKQDEMGDLARQFNSMAQQIQEVMKENASLNRALAQARDALQTRVEDATAELRQRNEELAAVNERLSIAQRDILRQQRLAVLGQLVATIAHKIGTPLTAISGHLQLLQEDPNLRQEVQERVRIMLKQTDRLTHSIQDLLTFTRTPTISVDEVSLPHLIDQSLLLFRPLLQEHGIHGHTLFAPDLLPVQGDALHLQEAINNIIDNAIDAMPDGGQLTIQAQNVDDSPDGGSEVIIEIQDSGPGIPPTHIEKIFDPFFTTKSLGSGTGLGLAITTEIIQLHKGHISVLSEEGRGTRFLLRLPAWRTLHHA